MNGYSAVTIPASETYEVPPVAVTQVRSPWLMLSAAAQILPAATARDIGVTEGRHRLGLFLLVCSLLGTIVPVEIAADSEMFVSRTIMGIPPHYALTAVTLALALLFDLRYYQRLATRPVVALGLGCLGLMLAVGVMRYGMRSHLLRSDIYIVRWFFVGFILMRFAIAAGMLRPYLVFATIVILLTAYVIDVKNTDAGQIDTAIKRASSSNLWPVVNCGMIMIGLLMTVTWSRSWIYAASGSAAFALLAFAGSIRTSTRSLFIAQAICFVLVLVALSRDPRMRGRGESLRRVSTVTAMVLVVWIAYLVVTGSALTRFTHLGKRFSETAAESRIGASRIDEAVQMVQEIEPSEWILGKGLGGMFYSTLGYWANTPHIGVLGWLQKGGIFIFGIVLLLVYVTPAVSFFKQVTRTRRSTAIPKPILVVGPPLIAWCLLTCISGGMEIGSFLGLGGLTALWIQLADDDALMTLAQRRDRGYGALQSCGQVVPLGATA